MIQRQCFTLVRCFTLVKLKALAGLTTPRCPQAAVINQILVIHCKSWEVSYHNQWHRESNGFRLIPLRQYFTLVRALAGLVSPRPQAAVINRILTIHCKS